MVSEPKKWSSDELHAGVIDSATLYLCRQGSRCVVVIESPRMKGAVLLNHVSSDSDGARSELLACVHQSCPDAVVMTTDEAQAASDYEWRIEVRGVATRRGDLGVALHRELSAESTHNDDPPHRAFGGRCHWSMNPAFSGRPRTF